MLSKVIVYATLLATTALGAALPSVEAAEKRGIDIRGAIPGDATAIPGGFTFEFGSEASAWVHAQIALGESSANIGIGMFTVKDCGDGRGAWFENVQYGARNTNILPYRYWSVGISGRALKSNEKLAFSQKGRGANNIAAYCATPISAAAPGAGVGSFNVQDINCFPLSRALINCTYM